eukprot:10492203-Prorocentrum_lima.AAC.1
MGTTSRHCTSLARRLSARQAAKNSCASWNVVPTRRSRAFRSSAGGDPSRPSPSVTNESGSTRKY